MKLDNDKTDKVVSADAAWNHGMQHLVDLASV